MTLYGAWPVATGGQVPRLPAGLAVDVPHPAAHLPRAPADVQGRDDCSACAIFTAIGLVTIVTPLRRLR